jgi:hypothetical protein
MIHRVRVRLGGRIIGGGSKHVFHTRSHHMPLRGGTIHHESNAAQLRKELTHLSVSNAPKPRPKKHIAVKLGYRN